MQAFTTLWLALGGVLLLVIFAVAIRDLYTDLKDTVKLIREMKEERRKYEIR